MDFPRQSQREKRPPVSTLVLYSILTVLLDLLRPVRNGRAGDVQYKFYYNIVKCVDVLSKYLFASEDTCMKETVLMTLFYI